MSEKAEVRFDRNPSEQAVLLLAAAEDLGLAPSVIETRSGAFYAPQEVVEKAFDGGVSSRKSADDEEEKPARRARKSTTTTKKDQE